MKHKIHGNDQKTVFPVIILYYVRTYVVCIDCTAYQCNSVDAIMSTKPNHIFPNAAIYFLKKFNENERGILVNEGRTIMQAIMRHVRHSRRTNGWMHVAENHGECGPPHAPLRIPKLWFSLGTNPHPQSHWMWIIAGTNRRGNSYFNCSWVR